MLSRAPAAQTAPGRDSSVTQLSSSQLSSRESVTNNMGRRCAHPGCHRTALTGGPKCYSHAPKPQAAPPIRGTAQMRSFDSSASPANARVKIEATSPARLDAWPSAINGPSRRSGDSQNPPHPAKGLSHKTLPTKATARKSIAKPGQRREDSNSAAADEAEIVVASDSTTSTNKHKASTKRAQDSVPDSPRKKQRLGPSNLTADSKDPKRLSNGATQKVPPEKPELSTASSSSRPTTTTTTGSSSTPSTVGKAMETDGHLRVGSHAKELSPLKAHVHLPTTLNGKPKEGNANFKKKKLRNTSASERASETSDGVLSTASSFKPVQGSAELEEIRSQSRSQAHLREVALSKAPVLDISSSSSAELNEGEANHQQPPIPLHAKPSSSSNTLSAPRPTESNRSNQRPAPAPAVKKPKENSAVNGQTSHKPGAAQSLPAYRLDDPFSLRPSVTASGRPLVEPSRPTPSTKLTNNAAEARISQPAVNPHPTSNPQIPEKQAPIASVPKTKPRTENAKEKTSGEETVPKHVPPPEYQATRLPSRPTASTSDVNSSTDGRNHRVTAGETTQVVSNRASSQRPPPPHPQGVSFSAQSQSARSHPGSAQNRRSDAKHENRQKPQATRQQPVASEYPIRTTEISHRRGSLSDSSLGSPLDTPLFTEGPEITAEEFAKATRAPEPPTRKRYYFGGRTYWATPAFVQLAGLPQNANNRMDSKMNSIQYYHLVCRETANLTSDPFRQEDPPDPRGLLEKTNRASHVQNTGKPGGLKNTLSQPPGKVKVPMTNGVTSTAKLDTDAMRLAKERNNKSHYAKPPRGPQTVIDLVSSDSDSPTTSQATSKAKTFAKTPREVQQGLRIPSVTSGPVPTGFGAPPKAGPVTNGVDDPRQVSQNPSITGEPVTVVSGVFPEDNPFTNGGVGSQKVWQKALGPREPAATMSGALFNGGPPTGGLNGSQKVLQKPSATGQAVAIKPGDKTSDSDKPLLTPDRRWSNVTGERWAALSLAQRKQMLRDVHDESKFDEYIYGSANSANHPRPSSRSKTSVGPSPTPVTAAPSNFRHFDPRVHWAQIRPKEWHERKQEEIADRGNRKAPQNFCRAAARRAQQKANARPRKVDLPERVEKNPKWVAALSELDAMEESYREDQRAKIRLRRQMHNRAPGKRDGDTEMRDVTPSLEATNLAPVIGGMRRPRLEVMTRGRWREGAIGE